jgi:hypothetical protein
VTGAEITTARNKMFRIAALCLGLIVAGLDLAAAQDIAGIEDCTKTTGLDKRTGCLQSNVNVLQQLVTKNALDARQRLTAANNEVVALKNEAVALKSDIATLKGLVTSLQKSLEELQAAQKAGSDKKPESK